MKQGSEKRRREADDGQILGHLHSARLGSVETPAAAMGIETENGGRLLGAIKEKGDGVDAVVEGAVAVDQRSGLRSAPLPHRKRPEPRSEVDDCRGRWSRTARKGWRSACASAKSFSMATAKPWRNRGSGW